MASAIPAAAVTAIAADLANKAHEAGQVPVIGWKRRTRTHTPKKEVLEETSVEIRAWELGAAGIGIGVGLALLYYTGGLTNPLDSGSGSGSGIFPYQKGNIFQKGGQGAPRIPSWLKL